MNREHHRFARFARPCVWLRVRLRVWQLVRPIAMALLSGSLLAPLASQADDSEVFFTRRDASDNNAANVLFMFDTSGSMAAYDNSDYRRITRMKQAMIDVIDSIDSVNIGIGTFNGVSEGGAILYPATAVDADVCENASCDEISLQVPVREVNDDGEQRSNGTVSLRSDSLHLSYQENLGSPVTLRVPITAAGDDVIVSSDGTLKSAGNELNFFHTDDDSPVGVGLRFADVPVPSGSQITSAHVEFDPVAGSNEGEVSALIAVDSAANSPAFSSTGAGRYDARSFSPRWQYWGRIPNTEAADDPVTRTPDISGLINEPISSVDWKSGNAITLRMVLPDDRISDGQNRRTFKSFESAKPPVLVLQYHTNGFQHNSVGLRFADVQVPRGAQVTRALVEFTTKTLDRAPGRMNIRGEKVVNSQPFTGVANEFSRRAKSAATVDWSLPAWETANEQRQTSDVSEIVQEITAQSGWCGGNALSLFFEGEGLRRAHSRDRSLWDAPVLKLSYEPGTVPMSDTCLSQQVMSRVASGDDDAIETLATGAMTIDGIRLSTGSAAARNLIGLRFDRLGIPQGATIASAYLEMRSPSAANSAAGPTLRIQDAGDADSFSAGAVSSLSDRELAKPSVVWTPLPKAEAGEVIRSPNLASLITAVTSRDDWRAGNALVLRLQSEADEVTRAFSSFETADAGPARLVVNYQVENPGITDTPVVLRTGRDALRETIFDFRASGATPLLDAYYEAAQYLIGGPVDFGRTRGSGGPGERIFRTSIPSSWQQGGGALLRPVGCTEDDLNSEACAGERITGDPDYDAPVAGICQANQIVLLSDGMASHNASQDRIRALTGKTSCEADNDDACGVELAQWLFERPADDEGHSANVVTHTVGFNFSGRLLKEVAHAGGGEFHTASSASELGRVFKRIIADTLSINTGFVAPTASVSQFNRLTHRDDIYYAMFRPDARPKWTGNLKRYRVGKLAGAESSIVLDADGDAVIDEETGQINPGVRSFWSSGDDGANVSLGGAAHELSLTGRNVKTFVPAADSDAAEGTTDGASAETEERDTSGVNTALGPTATAGASQAQLLVDLSEDNDDIDAELLRIDADDADFRDKLLRWARGVDVLDSDGDGNRSEVRAQMGDPMHSAPFIMNYASTAENGKSVVFVGTNEGFLHAIDTAEGREEFAFIPPELLRNLKTFYRNETDDVRPYGLDGAVSGWMDDTNGNLVVDETEKAYVVVGMRRGGRNYYALDVSDPDKPVLQWVIRGGVGDFAELGQTWSKPVYTRIRVGGIAREVLIFAGGYDTDNDTREVRGTGDGVGRALFVVNPADGQLLATYDHADDTDMDYSLPSDVNVVDWNLDGLADHAFVGDMGGQIWRFDFDDEITGRATGPAAGESSGESNAESNAESTAESTASIRDVISGGVIADFGNAGTINNRRFFYPPDVALIKDDSNETFLNLAVGSGWRSHPLDEQVQDRFYVFRDAAVQGPPRDRDGVIAYTTITDADGTDLVDATEANVTAGTSATAKAGWYMDLEAVGEKVLGPSVTINGQVLFTSYLPDSGDQSLCRVSVGKGRLYALDIFTAAAMPGTGTEVDERGVRSGNRYRWLKTEGIPPPVSVLLLSGDEGRASAGLESVKDVNFGPGFRHTHWAEE